MPLLQAMNESHQHVLYDVLGVLTMVPQSCSDNEPTPRQQDGRAELREHSVAVLGRRGQVGAEDLVVVDRHSADSIIWR